MSDPKASLKQAKKINVSFTVNGQRKVFKTYPMARLLDVLREEAKLTGAKEGCGEGECGACSVLVNNVLVNSCLVPVCQVVDAKITTVEGLSQGSKLNKIQDAFLKHGGAQCGICTPGMLMAASHLLSKKKRVNKKDVQEGLAGNLCRCTGYTKILDSVLAAAASSAPTTRSSRGLK